jgi:hypothetical protein
VCACVCSSDEDADGKAAPRNKPPARGSPSAFEGVGLLESARSNRRVFSSSGPGRKKFYRENRQKDEWWRDRTQEVVGLGV